jgi:hypothetical protein
MYTSFEVKNFRGFKDLSIKGLERINLIAGVNNIGKTALLEALFLHCGAYNLQLVLNINAFRGIESVKIEFKRWGETPWDSLFYQYDTHAKIKMVGNYTKAGYRAVWLSPLETPEELANISLGLLKKPEELVSTENSEKSLVGEPELAFTSTPAKVLKLEYEENGRVGTYNMIFVPGEPPRLNPLPPEPPFPAFFQLARVRFSLKLDAEFYGKLELQGKQDVLLQVLKIIEPRLKRVAVVITGGEPILHGDIGMGRLLPLPVMGDGMARLASLVLRIVNAPGGVVLIDEIENGLHHSIMPKLWTAIGDTAREFDTQVFATTHSLECIKAAHRAFTEGEKYDLRVHRLEHTKKGIKAVTYDQEDLDVAFGMSMEVR